MIKDQPVARVVPMTYPRAATALAQSRVMLDKARSEMTLAIDILGSLDDSLVPGHDWPAHRDEALDQLRDALGDVADVRNALDRVRVRLGSSAKGNGTG